MTNLTALLTEILEDHSNGYTYFEYPLTYGVWSGQMILEGENLLIHLEDDTHEMTAHAPIKAFKSDNVEYFESWVNTNLYYNTTEKEV